MANWVQARGKYMIPGYKVILFGSFGASMYMMGRLVLVSRLCAGLRHPFLTVATGTQDMVGKELDASGGRGGIISRGLPYINSQRNHHRVSFI